MINIKNKKASFQYYLIDTYTAGIVLLGTEIKSIREGKVSFVDSYCTLIEGELWLKGLHISEYTMGGHYNHEPRRDRKLLLKRSELRRIENKYQEKGLTIVPLSVFINEKGIAKVVIAIAKGKKLYDKREAIKKRDIERDSKQYI